MTPSQKLQIGGIITPMLTPFTEDNEIDIKTLEIFVDWLTGQTIHALFAMGGSGEWQFLTIKERKIITDCVVQAAAKRLPVFTNVGANSLQETLELAQYAEKAGVDGITVVTPDFIEGSQEALFNYYQTIDAAIDIPVFIYDPQGKGPHSPTPATMVKMLDNLKHITAMKYRTIIGEDMANMLRAVGHRMSIVSGAETVYLPDLALGTVGVVGGGCNIYPHLIWNIHEQFMAANFDAARQQQFEVLQHCDALGAISWPCSGKIALNALGLPFTFKTRANSSSYTPADVEYIQRYFRKLLK